MTPWSDSRTGPAIWALAVGQTLAYGCFFYMFSSLLVTLEAETEWSKSQLALGPTVSALVAAGLTPISGRLVDRGAARWLLSGLPVLGALGLVVIASAHSHAQWIAGWMVVGIATSGLFYETTFAFVTRRLKSEARRAIIRITLVAGFASTITYPAGAYLGQTLGWRGAILCFAAATLVVLAPLNWFGTSMLRRGQGKDSDAIPEDQGAVARALRKPAFWMIGGMFAVMWMVHFMLITFAIPIFMDRGVTLGLAVLAASLIGQAQVIGRLVLMVLQDRAPSALVAQLTALGTCLAMISLWLAGLQPVLIFVFAVVQGASIGVVSVIRPILTAELLGRGGFGAISGVLAVPTVLGASLAPSIGAFLIEVSGPQALIGFALAASCAAFAVSVVIRRIAPAAP